MLLFGGVTDDREKATGGNPNPNPNPNPNLS